MTKENMLNNIICQRIEACRRTLQTKTNKVHLREFIKTKT